MSGNSSTNFNINIIGVCGTIGSGKNTVANLIASRYGYKKVSFGALVREEVQKSGLKPTRENCDSFSKKMTEEHGGNYWPKKVAELVKKSGWKNVVVSGIRRPADVSFLSESFGRFYLIMIDARPEARFEREKSKGLPGFPETIEDFLKQEEAQEKLFSLRKTMGMADVELENSLSLEHLVRDLDHVMKDKLSEHMRVMIHEIMEKHRNEF